MAGAVDRTPPQALRRSMQLPLAGLALAAVVAVVNFGTRQDQLGLRRMLSVKVKETPRRINLNAPYAPHRGPVEPVAPLPLEEEWRNLKDGEYMEHSTTAEPDDAYDAAEESNVAADPAHRQLSRFVVSHRTGGVKCYLLKTRGPKQIPEDIDFANTIIAGYPGADKRIVLRQMESMTRLSGRDSWDFEFLGMTRQPFIKTNFPHHEGIWGWQDHGDQVILVIRNIRSTIDEYHDILSDIDYAKTWIEATEKIPRLYKGELNNDLYVRWRDERTMDEIGWYGWFIDYWMEGGVLRDYFDHKLTTQEHWDLLRQPETYTYGELQWDVNNCETDPPPAMAIDPNCDPSITTDCKAKVVIGAERLMDTATGHAEHRKIALLLNSTRGVRDEMIKEPGWDCLYDLIIGNNQDGAAMYNTEGFDDYRARKGVKERKHVISHRHLNKMVQQLTRLINKYSAYDPETDNDWANNPVSQNLVEILTEHRVTLQAELDAMSPDLVWAHPPKPNWVVFPKCGAEQRRVWDYDYPHEYSGEVLDMFPDVA